MAVRSIAVKYNYKICGIAVFSMIKICGNEVFSKRKIQVKEHYGLSYNIIRNNNKSNHNDW